MWSKTPSYQSEAEGLAENTIQNSTTNFGPFTQGWQGVMLLLLIALFGPPHCLLNEYSIEINIQFLKLYFN